MVADLDYGIKTNVQRKMTDLTEMIREEEVSEFLAHGITVEQSTKQSELEINPQPSGDQSSMNINSPKGMKEIFIHFKNPLSPPE